MKSNKEFCPYCNADLQGKKIPQESQYAYGATNFTREIGSTSLNVDRIIKWQCSDCKSEWER